MSDELDSANDIDRLLVSSGLSTPIFILIGNDDCSSCQSDSMLKYRQKLALLSFLRYLVKIESDSQNVWTCMYTIVPGSVLLMFKS